MVRAIDAPRVPEWYATTSASAISCAAFSVISSGSPGPTPTPYSRPVTARSSWARALSAATRTAPSRRGDRARRGTGCPTGCATSACLDSAEPTKPTGMPMIAAGRGPPSAISSSRWNRAVGALPIATTAPSRLRPPQRHRRRRPGGAPALGQRRDPRIVQQAADRRCPPAAVDRVIPAAIICASVKIGAPACERVAGGGPRVGMDVQVADEADVAAGVDHPDRDHLGVRGHGR